MPSPSPAEANLVADPWVTCFLTSMLIRFLDGVPAAAAQVDYQRVIGVVEGFDHIREPKRFLLDPNNWVPHAVLREFIQRSDAVSGQKHITYRAALADFASTEGRRPPLLEPLPRY